VRIVINGNVEDVDDRTTVAELVKRWSRTEDGIAVAVNDAVVSRGDWGTAVLDENDRVEILTAVQGG
jgi:sulfur carrier protein